MALGAGNTAMDVERICRICLKEENEQFLIFETIPNRRLGNGPSNMTICDILTECTRYRVERHDDMPHQVCGKCMEEACNAYGFIRKSEQSYRTLVDILKLEARFKEDHNDVSVQTEEVSVYPCELCDNKYFDALALNAHRTQDHRDVSLNCKSCGKVFDDLRHLRTHMSTKHPELGIINGCKCPICNKVFTRRDHMRRHMRTLHDTDVNRSFWPHPHEKKAVLAKEVDKKPDSTELVDPLQRNDIEEPEGVAHIKIEPESGASTIKCQDASVDANKNNRKASLDEPEIDFETNICGNAITTTSVPGESPWPLPFKSDENEYDDELAATNPFSSDEEEDEDDCVSVSKQPIDIKMEDSNLDDTSPAAALLDRDKEDITKNEKSKLSEANNAAKDSASKAKVTEHGESLKSKARKCRRISDTAKYSKEEPSSCKVCGRTFTRHCHLLRHMLTHSEEKKHECGECEKKFKRKDHLTKHIRSVHGEKQYKCDQCNAAFSQNTSLGHHKEHKHCADPSALKVHSCDFCGKKFMYKNYLRQHLLMHTDRVFECKHCNQRFKDRKEYKEHERGHTQADRNFLCSMCGESFVRADYLRVHMRRHTGEKPYKCQYCCKGFPRATDLKMHERYHTNIKPHKCNLCDKAFHRAYNLTIHMRTHTGERPYKCDHCPQAFAQSNDLKAHIRRHTGERFKCTECDAAFLQMYCLRQHAASAHGIQIESSTGRLQKFSKRMEEAIRGTTQTAELIGQDHGGGAGDGHGGIGTTGPLGGSLLNQIY